MVKKIVVIGMGYVGIPAAALFADVEGFNVVGIQRRSKRSGWKIDWLNEGKNPIGGDEPGLSELIKKVVKKGSFHVTDDFSECKDADYILIDVQTPTDEKGIPKYESLKEASKQVGRHMKNGVLVVIESTVAPGTTENVVRPILEKESKLKAGKDFSLAYSYERVMVGRLLHNIINYPRIIGGIDGESARRAMDLYKNIVKAKLYLTDVLTAEMSKVVENAYRDVNIAFANEIALMCESLRVDAFKVRELVNTLPNDPSNPSANPIRNMHFPGAGTGGHCLPKDPWLLKYGVDQYGKYKVEPNIIIKSRELNMWMPTHMADLLEEGLNEAGQKIKDAKIAILGVAFLENSDDTRNTPAKPLYEILKKKGAKPVMHDSYVRDYELPFVKDINEAITGADALVIVTKHKEYLNLNLRSIKNKMRTPIIIDGRNAYDREKCEEEGFIYKGIGKPM
ncbi:MAG: nucleotide sugar dehydrogenase [Candidatus Thermoplasmatota archaeon]|nr:nucleotide sugar dehydrogenase [Candidatus Thermoplasmatota archaeon]